MKSANDLSAKFAEDDALTAAANHGDRAAEAEYVRKNISFLLAMARKIAGESVDPDDLLSDALAALLALWRRGAGPEYKANAYLIRSMRNRMIDEFRAPRSRVQALEDVEAKLPVVETLTDQVDLHREFAYVAAALEQLPADQRTLITATVIEGRKPAELEVELGRPVSSVYSLGRRARIALRRQTLKVMLDEDAPVECSRAAAHLPGVVELDPDSTKDSAGMAHIRQCARCRRVWARFGATSTLLGVTTLLVAGNTLLAPAPAQATEGDAQSSNSASTRQVRRLSRRALTAGIAGGASIVVGLGIVVVASVISLSNAGSSSTAPAEDAAPLSVPSVTVTSQTIDDDRARLEIGFSDVRELDVEMTISVPQGVTIVGTPSEWSCDQGDTAVQCRVDDPQGGTVELVDARDGSAGTFTVDVTGSADDQALSGRVFGGITSDPLHLTVTAE